MCQPDPARQGVFFARPAGGKMKRAFGFLIFAAVASIGAAAEKRPITERDLLQFHWIADPQISPDGRSVAYVLVSVNEKEDRYDTNVWVVPAAAGSEPRRLTEGSRDFAPRWSPDGRTLAFLRSGPEKDHPQSQLYLLPMAGGEPRKLTDLPKGASPAAWSPDGKRIAFASGTIDKDLEEQKAEKKGEKPKKSDVRVITRAVYRRNGAGWIDPTHPSHVWVADLAGDGLAAARPLTSGHYDEGEITWSRDGARILFVSDRVDEPYYDPPDSNLYAVPAAG